MNMTATETHTARKTHRCQWCWQCIEVGTKYRRYRFYDGGDVGTVKMPRSATTPCRWPQRRKADASNGHPGKNDRSPTAVELCGNRRSVSDARARLLPGRRASVRETC